MPLKAVFKMPGVHEAQQFYYYRLDFKDLQNIEFVKRTYLGYLGRSLH